MLRRTYPRLNAYNNTTRGAYERNRMENQKMRARIYNKTTGNIDPVGLAGYLWEKLNYFIAVPVGIVVGFFVYSKIVNAANKVHTVDQERKSNKRLEYLRTNPKLRGEKYLCDNMRQIEDPDFDNVPCHTLSDPDDPDYKPNICKAFLETEEMEKQLTGGAKKWER